MWSQIADNSSLLVEIMRPSLLWIFQEEFPSFVNLRVMTILSPYSFGLYASSPWFLMLMVTSETLWMGEYEINCKNIKRITLVLL